MTRPTDPGRARRHKDTAKHLAKFQWKPGQSGNPKGSEKGSRHKLTQDFLHDIHESWKILGKPAITTVAWTDPSTYLKVVASLIPRDIEVTITNSTLEKMTCRELEDLIRATEADGIEDPLEAKEGPGKVFTVD